MDPQNNYWYLEHIVTGKKIILQSGENTLGRHSTCKLVLKDYDYLSRQHAKITVDITNSVILEQMTTPNGVFVNQTKLAKDVYVYSLKNGDRIGLGVEVQRNEAVHPRYAVFILKENRVNIKDIIIISDDEDEEENYLLENNFGNKKPIDNLNIDRDRPSPANKPLSLKADKKPSGSIHLPILPEVKQEILSQASKEIENIFGEPDEELLESVLNINPYIYKQLNNNNLSTAGKKLCDGEKIEVPEEINMPENKLLVSKPSNPSIIDEIVLDDEEYDENFAMSQAVLREMKEEMADEFIELSDNEIDEQNEKNQLCNFKTEIATQHIEDEIILIEDEYDDLFSKVTDWSSKLLSQNVMSQVYPLEDEELQSPIDEMDVGKQALQFCTESRSCSIEDDHTNVTFHKGTRTTAPQVDSSVSEYNTVSPEVCKIRRCRILLKPISKPQCQTINQESTESKKMLEQVSDCCSKKNTSSGSDVKKAVNNQIVLQNEPNTVSKKPSSLIRPDYAINMSDNKNLDEIAEWLQLDSSNGQHNVKDRTLSVIDTLEDQLQDNECLNTKSKLKSSETISSPTKSIEFEPLNIKLGPVSEKKQRNSRLLNRSKSLYSECPSTSPTNFKEKLLSPTSSSSKNNDENSRGPKVISAPHLPKCRGKLRGVSAGNNKEFILMRQRLADNETKMKAKWYQKPDDKKQENEGIKKKRRELLKRLAEKPKCSIPTDTFSKLNRNSLKIPTLCNSNRGEFLTKEEKLPPTKRLKIDKTTRSSEKRIVKRRATIECFSQKTIDLNETDEALSSAKQLVRPAKRKEAEIARNQRTCNRVTFADMESDFQLRQLRDKQAKKNRHVRFNDTLHIIPIDRVEGANKKVRIVKDTKKLTLSTYSERREWAMALGKLENYNDIITGDILSWGNEWLKTRNADEVAESDVLMPIPSEFSSYKQYKETFIPLMKLELLTTIQRENKFRKSSFEVKLRSFSKENSRHRPRFVLVTRCSYKPFGKFDLYTLSSGNALKEIFATMSHVQYIADDTYEIKFEILQRSISMDLLHTLKELTVSPIVDNIRVELGAFSALYQLSRSPLFQRILKPCEKVLTFDPKLLKGMQYKGFKRLDSHQLDICLSTSIRLMDDSEPSITLIQGPPGTGKSAVISNLALQCMYGSSNHTLDRKILICAHSNAAVDNITLSLKHARNCMSHTQFEIVRFGIFEKMDMNVREMSVEHYLRKKRAAKRDRLTADNIMHLKKQQEDLKSEIANLRERNAGVSSLQQQMKTKERQLRLINERLNPPLTPREENEYIRTFIQRANIVCTTLSSCVKLASYIDYFDACIIDEATQCTEPWTLLPLRFGVRGLVLVGDTQQLPATVLSQKAINYGLGNSMFDRIQRNVKQQLDKPKPNNFMHTKVYKLSMQYRMHPEICKWPNSYFYEGQLINDDSTQRLIAPIIPYCVINLSYTRDTNDMHSRSISNDEEARFVANLLIELNKHMPTDRFRYGLITPYSNQCYALSQVIPSDMKIAPCTVDAYQGQQRDVIIISNARTRGVGFLTNYQRLNVAITRPQRCLIICGNFDDLQSVDMWRHLLNDARDRGVYFDLSRSDTDDLKKSLISRMLVKPVTLDDTP